MLSILLAAAVALGPARPSPVHFQMTVTPVASGYQLDCATGCTWTTLTFACQSRANCHMVIDQDGVYTAPHGESSTGTGFAFEFSARPGGWELISDRGTAWDELGWQCSHNCASNVNEFGVRGAAAP